jgi:hypothetical protein
VTTYLHGNAGRTQQEDAVRILRGLDIVRSVEVSRHSWTILVVHLGEPKDVPEDEGVTRS